MVVLDTSALLYWTLAGEELSAKAAETIDGAQEIIISSISIWEIGLKAKRGKLDLPMPVGEYVERLKEVEKVKIVPVTEVIWLANLDLGWDHKDPADRTIVATAGLLGSRLITSDQQILSFYAAAVW
jgi:PIN domain nuclease of toxin-antitoxin system